MREADPLQTRPQLCRPPPPAASFVILLHLRSPWLSKPTNSSLEAKCRAAHSKLAQADIPAAGHYNLGRNINF